MMKIDTNRETPAKPNRTFPMMSMVSLNSAFCSLSSVALSTTSVPRVAASARWTENGSAPSANSIWMVS